MLRSLSRCFDLVVRRGFILAAVTWQLAAVLFLGSAVVPMALAQDSEAPLLVDFDFNPKSIDVSSGPADVTCTMAATDDPARKSGLMRESLAFSHESTFSCRVTLSAKVWNPGELRSILRAQRE